MSEPVRGKRRSQQHGLLSSLGISSESRRHSGLIARLNRASQRRVRRGRLRQARFSSRNLGWAAKRNKEGPCVCHSQVERPRGVASNAETVEGIVTFFVTSFHSVSR